MFHLCQHPHLQEFGMVTRLPDKEKEHVFVFLDAFLAKMKMQGTL